MNTPDIQEVYRKRVLDHSRAPHNFGAPESFNREAHGFNPLCGDKVTIYLNINDGRLDKVNFAGHGCAISMASASMMTDALSGLNVAQAHELIQQLQGLFSSDAELTDQRMQELKALEGVRKYPSRVKCATLAWTAMQSALDNNNESVSTE